MEYVGFSFHFMLMADCKKAKAAVARIQKDCHYAKASQVRGGIDVASLRVGDDYFYARWLKPIKLHFRTNLAWEGHSRGAYDAKAAWRYAATPPIRYRMRISVSGTS